MNTPNFDKQANVLKVIGHPTRLQLMQLLRQQGATSVTVICESLDIEQSLISHHLAKLKAMGVLSNKRKGKQMLYSLTDLVQMNENGNVTVNAIAKN